MWLPEQGPINVPSFGSGYRDVPTPSETLPQNEAATDTAPITANWREDTVANSQSGYGGPEDANSAFEDAADAGRPFDENAAGPASPFDGNAAVVFLGGPATAFDDDDVSVFVIPVKPEGDSITTSFEPNGASADQAARIGPDPFAAD